MVLRRSVIFGSTMVRDGREERVFSIFYGETKAKSAHADEQAARKVSGPVLTLRLADVSMLW
jgi:hypothetical protein